MGGSWENLFRPNETKYPMLSNFNKIRNGSFTALGKTTNQILWESTTNLTGVNVNNNLEKTGNVVSAIDIAEKISRVNEIAFDEDLSSQEKYVMGTMATYDVFGAFATAPAGVPVAAGVGICAAIGGGIALAKKIFINNVNFQHCCKRRCKL